MPTPELGLEFPDLTIQDRFSRGTLDHDLNAIDFAAGMRGASVYRSTPQRVSNAGTRGAQPLHFDAIWWDTDSMANLGGSPPGQFIQTSGLYIFTLNAGFAYHNAAGELEIGLYVVRQGTSWLIGQQNRPMSYSGGGDDVNLSCSAVWLAQPGDLVAGWVWQDLVDASADLTSVTWVVPTLSSGRFPGPGVRYGGSPLFREGAGGSLMSGALTWNQIDALNLTWDQIDAQGLYWLT